MNTYRILGCIINRVTGKRTGFIYQVVAADTAAAWHSVASVAGTNEEYRLERIEKIIA